MSLPKSPSSKNLRKYVSEEQKKQIDEAKKKQNNLMHAVRSVTATPEGRIFFRDMLNYTGRDNSKVVVAQDSKTVDLVSTAFNAAMENVYLRYRRLMRREHIIKIELTQED